MPDDKPKSAADILDEARKTNMLEGRTIRIRTGRDKPKREQCPNRWCKSKYVYPFGCPTCGGTCGGTGFVNREKEGRKMDKLAVVKEVLDAMRRTCKEDPWVRDIVRRYTIEDACDVQLSLPGATRRISERLTDAHGTPRCIGK